MLICGQLYLGWLWSGSTEGKAGRKADFAKRRQAVHRTGAVAGIVNFAVFAGHREFPAGRGAVFINGALHRFARRSLKGDAAAGLMVCTAHTAQKRVDLLGEMRGDNAARIIAFTPVKRDTKKGAAGATRHARIYIAHFPPAITSRKQHCFEANKVASAHHNGKCAASQFLTNPGTQTVVISKRRVLLRPLKLMQINEC